jgi:hypothetical protein
MKIDRYHPLVILGIRFASPVLSRVSIDPFRELSKSQYSGSVLEGILEGSKIWFSGIQVYGLKLSNR